MTEKYIFRYMRNRFWLLRNNYPKKHATSNRNINAYDRGLYLQVEIVFGTLESNILVKNHLTEISCYTLLL